MPNFNPYFNNFIMQDLQGMRDRIDRTMQQYQQNQMQSQQPMQPITQNFQIAPTQQQTELESKYVSNIDEVKNTFVLKTGIFLTKDLSNLWIKDTSGNIKTYKLEEVVELDEKDRKIQEQDYEILALKKQVKELKGVITNANTDDSTDISTTVTNKKSSGVSKNKSDDTE